jgi:hypothetical protein
LYLSTSVRATFIGRRLQPLVGFWRRGEFDLVRQPLGRLSFVEQQPQFQQFRVIG